jgi:hypothetical protein
MTQSQLIPDMLESEVFIGPLSYFSWAQILLIVGIFGGILAITMILISKSNKEVKHK